tara:strand:+ start:356 stop:1303 length:948 start_codon:yes stop_codon:yes gene_type:complete
MLKLARVQEIILNEGHISYKGEADIGTILYTLLDEPPPEDVSQCRRARPMNINIVQYPIPNEIVVLIPGPSKNYNSTSGIIDYYLPPQAIQKDPNLNALPNALNQNLDFFKGDYFQELEYIRPMKPYEGDIILEGRFGNSIRFGHTIPSNYPGSPTWGSRNEKSSTPIITIRNGQQPSSTRQENYRHIVEDINKDDSSIYLCSDQQIPIFEIASLHNNSYQTDIKSEKYEEPIIEDEPLTEDTLEDIVLAPADPLPPMDQQIMDELSDTTSTDTAHYDISPTENQSISTNDNLSIPPSYDVPDNVSDNYLIEQMQ